MGAEAVQISQATEQRQQLQFDPDTDPALLSGQLLEEITPEINTVLNERIGYEVQSNAAKKLENPLIASQDLARLSDEIRLHQAGDNKAELSEAAKEAIERGETPASLLEKAFKSRDSFLVAKTEKEDVLDFDEVLDDARTDYVTTLMQRPKLKGKKAHKEKLATSEAKYNEAFLNKVAKIMDLDPNHHKAPYTKPVGVNFAKENPTLEDLSDNQLHVLVDQLAREKLNKAQEIESLSNRGVKRVLNALSNSRGLRVAVGAAIWTGSLVASSKGLLPEGAKFVGEGAEMVLPLVAGYFTSREVLNGVDEGVTRFKHNRQLKRDINDLTSTTLLTEQTLRTVYSGIEYQDGLIKNRRGGETQMENKAAIGNINSEFAKLQRENSRGGKPYSAEQILPYVADLYLRRKEKLDAIVTSEDPKTAFLQLCDEVITADTKEMTDRQEASRAKRAAFRALSVCSTAFVGQWMGQIRDMQELSTKPIKMFQADAV